ncbi:MAG: pilus assembly protein [Bdellovibrionales bacterium]
MRFLFSLLLTISFAGLSASEAQVKAKALNKKNVDLRVGLQQDEVMSYMPENPSFVGDFKRIVKVSLNKKERKLRFDPIRVGTGTLSVMDERGRKVFDYLITISKGQLSQVMREVKGLLADIEGIEIKIINNKVVVDGQILLPKDLNRIYSVVSQYPDMASSLVTLSPLAQKKIAEFIERDINNPEIHVRPVNEKFMLEGVANDEAEKQRAEIIAKTYIPDTIVEAAEAGGIIKKRKLDAVINLLMVKPGAEPEPGKIIQLTIHYVELQKDYTKGFRFQFTPDVSDSSRVDFSSGGREPGGVVSQITATVSNLLPKLNWASQHGHARVLQSSTIIVQDGKEGKLQSTTSVPYQVVGQGGLPSTSFQDAGIITSITPKLISSKSDTVDMKIDFALKSLLGITDKGPMISNSAIQTIVSVRSGQSAAIGGLVSSSSGADYNKLPKNVSENPIISLYASKSFRRNQSQFVVFITPIVKSSASAGSERIKQKFRLKD